MFIENKQVGKIEGGKLLKVYLDYNYNDTEEVYQFIFVYSNSVDIVLCDRYEINNNFLVLFNDHTGEVREYLQNNNDVIINNQINLYCFI